MGQMSDVRGRNGGRGLQPGAPAVDLDHLRRFTRGDHALEAEVLGMFVDNGPTYVQALRQASTDTAWVAAAHTLKGTAWAIGAWRVGQLAEAAERLKTNPDLALRRLAVGDIERAVAEAAAFIRNWLAAHAA